MKEDAPRVIKIPAKPEATRQAEARRQLRVAAYCRVSTKEEDQANSYEVQKEYITEWDESAVRQLVETVKILSKDEVAVTLKGGIEICQKIMY